jgi:hypothetical protein
MLAQRILCHQISVTVGITLKKDFLYSSNKERRGRIILVAEDVGKPIPKDSHMYKDRLIQEQKDAIDYYEYKLDKLSSTYVGLNMAPTKGGMLRALLRCASPSRAEFTCLFITLEVHTQTCGTPFMTKLLR